MSVQRFDQGQITISRTPSGGLRVDAYVTRTGVLEYKLSDGSIRRELRRPEQVFAEDSIASLRGACVTDGHPTEMVTPGNWGTYARGHIGDDARPDGDKLRASVNVNHADLLAKIDAGEIRECSCGYLAEYVAGAGVFEGEAYDGEQTNIRYNHVALGGIGWGRAGSEVRLLLDSNSAISCASPESGTVTEPDPGSNAKGEEMRITFDGKEYDLTKPDDARAYQAACDAKIAALVGRADAAEVRAAAAEARATPEAIAAVAAERARLIGYGRAKDRRFLTDKKDAAMPMDQLIARLLKMYAPSYDPAGKSPDVLAEVLAAVLPAAPPDAAAEPAATDGAQETPMGGAEDPEKPAAPPAQDSIHGVRGIGARTDAAPSSAGTSEAIFDEIHAQRMKAAALPPR